MNEQKHKSRIAARSRNMNTILLVLILLLMMVTAGVFVDGINSDAAANLVRAHSIEAAEKFYAYISQDLALVQKAARSKAVTSWFAAEKDEEKKAEAFYEMMDYAGVLQGVHMYLGINATLNEYTVDGTTAIADIVPFDQLSQTNPSDEWYFECAFSENDYVLKIDEEKLTNTWWLWINHKVMEGGNFVGVFCSGIRIPDIFHEVFVNYDEKKVRGYIIDRHGIVQSASTAIGIYIEGSENHIREESTDPAFAAALSAYENRINGFFGFDSLPEIVRLTKGPFGYAAIEPIRKTDWSIVVFFNNYSLAGVINLLPLLIVMLSAMLVYVVSRNAIMNYLIFSPLNHLTQSVSKGEIDFFGSGRDDEIGELARTIQEMRDERQRQEQLLHAVNSTATVLLAPMDDSNFEALILDGMEHIGQNMDVDRINIWRNETIDGVFCYVNQFQWLRNDAVRKGKPAVAMRPYSENPEWERKFLLNEYINGPVSGRTQQEQFIMGPQGVKTILAIPLFWNKELYGFFSFDDFYEERTFTEDEVNIMRSAGLMMINALIRNTQAAHLRQAHQYTQVLLDTMPLACNLFHNDAKIFDCNEKAVSVFNTKNKQEYLDRFWDLSPEYQIGGQKSFEKARMHINKAFDEGKDVFEWLHQSLDGMLLPMEVTLVRVKIGDEFIVAGYARDLREYKQMMNEIEQGANLLNTVNQAATILLQSGIDEFKSDLHRCMGMIAGAVNVDRVTIWKNHTRNEKLCCTQIYEWVGNAESQINSEITIDMSCGESMFGWEEILSQGKCINKVICDMPPAEQTQLSRRGILSIFVAPVFVHDTFWGFVSFDDCHSETLFSENEESTLHSGSLLIAAALLRNEIMLNLQTTAAKLEAVIANYAGIIWSVDQNNVITLFNGLYLNELGSSPEFFEGKKLNDALQDKRFLGIPLGVQKTFTDGPQDLSAEVEDKMYRTRTTPIYDNNGSVINVVGSFDDITERTRLQKQLKAALSEAQKASRAKSSFLANMSHEMRTPLNAVIGLSELTLETAKLSEEAGINLEKIYNAGSTLLSTVNDILDISKIEAGRLELVPVEYDVPSLINDAITQSIMRIGEKPVKFVLDVDENLPTRLYGDDLRIKQILNNLLSNAFKYTKDGTVKLDVSCEQEGEMVWLIARVSDTGMGIRSGDLENLFNDYSQVDAVSNRKIEGTGLGLSITKKVAELMGGSIGVKSEYGKGSVFTVKVRQQFVTSTVIGAEAVRSLKNLQYSDNKRSQNLRLTRIKLPYARVLIVDDVVTNLDVAKGMMKPYGLQIDCVTSGQEAVGIIRDEKVRYNAVFMDHMMPDMDGIETTKIIREEIGTEYARTVPIIALTANAIVGNEAMFLSKGFQAFLPKPIEIARLDAVIREWVRDKEMEKNLDQISVDGETIPDARSGEDRRIGIDRRTLGKKINGIDIGKGIERFGGDEESYLQVLYSFVINTPPLLEKVKEVAKESLADYGILVHGLKSSSQGICADLLGARAEALEKAAREGDYDFVLSHNDGFIEAAEKLISVLDNMIRQMASDKPRPKKDKPDNGVLLKLLAACKDYDMDSVDAAMLELGGFEYESDDGLAVWLRENVEQMNFEQVKKKLSDMAD
ncbi:MAG: ATP-binding protein [Treponema sp.]|nr:ATP-binding protein [Treponema sp.]